jgi:hypothetical protein
LAASDEGCTSIKTHHFRRRLQLERIELEEKKALTTKSKRKTKITFGKTNSITVDVNRGFLVDYKSFVQNVNKINSGKTIC